MTAKEMLRLCERARDRLDDLDAMLAYIPEEQQAHTFMRTSISDLIELEQIAKWETVRSVTKRQAQHIRRILSKTQELMRIASDKTHGQFDDEPPE